MNIRLCDGPIAPANSARRDTYFQQFIAGTAAAAIFVASLGEVLFLGLTRQLLGPPWAPCHSFQYAGSIGPLPAGGALARQLLRIGQTLAGEFELRGIFGVDGILRDDGFWTVEVNPRYTASVELLEWSQGRSALALHARAFGHEESPEFFRAPAGGCFGKLICFARRRARAGPRFAERVRQWNEGREFPLVADIPRPGEIIAAGHPVATVLAEAADELEVEAQLQARARQLDDLLEAPEA